MTGDLQMVRDLLPAAPPPTAEVTDAARARLMAAAAGGGPGHQHREPRRRTARRLAAVPRWRLAVPALATAAAVAVAAILLTSGHVTGSQVPPGQPAKLTARDVLLAAAAATAASATSGPSTGKYLAQTYVYGNLIASGPNSHPYVTEQISGLSVSWQPTSPGTEFWYVSANYTSRLPTPGAISAWRADGSPPLPQQSGQRPQVSKGPGDLTFGNEEITVAQLQALPSSTAGLREAIVKALQATPAPRDGSTPGGNLGITDECVGLVSNAAVPPAVRAAALRILAAMPDLSVTGQVSDPLGRTGYRVTLPGAGGIGQAGGNDGTPKARFEMFISPSGAMLGQEYVTTVPTTGLATVMPASGAIPGPTSCQAGQEQIGNQCWIKVPQRVVVVDPKGTRRTITVVGREGPVLTLGAPVLAVPAGTVVTWTAFLSSGLTNATPSATTIPSLPPVSAASPSASASVSPSPAAPSQSPSPATPSPTTAPSTPSQTPSATSPASSPSASTPSPAQSSSPS